MVVDPNVRHLALGQLGERIAEIFLAGRGVRVLDRNVRRGRGELDLVAVQGDVVFAVEVKTARRSSGVDPRENLDDRKLDQVRATARMVDVAIWRVDLIAVIVGRNGVDIRWLREVE